MSPRGRRKPWLTRASRLVNLPGMILNPSPSHSRILKQAEKWPTPDVLAYQSQDTSPPRARVVPMSADDLKRAVHRYQEGASLVDIGAELRRAPSTIDRRLAGAGVQLRSRAGWNKEAPPR